jgi:hypothetical protein
MAGFWIHAPLTRAQDTGVNIHQIAYMKAVHIKKMILMIAVDRCHAPGAKLGSS